MKSALIIAWTSAAACCFLVGCSAWHATPPSDLTLKLPTPRLASNSVAVDLTFVRIPLDDVKLDQTIWAEVDEQCVSPEGRQHLNANGIRVGILGQKLPSALIRLLEKSASGNIGLTEVLESDVLTKHRHQRWKTGQRVSIVTTAEEDSVVLLHKKPSDVRLSGKTFEQAQGFIAAKPFLSSDEQIRLELVPEVHYGRVQQQWIAADGTFQLQSGKQRFVLTDLESQIDLTPGQSVLISSTAIPTGVGELLFVDKTNGDPQKKLLLIRICRSGKDDLFEQLSPPKE